jgi:hypothetical protein
VAKDPAQRFASVEDLAKALAPFALERAPGLSMLARFLTAEGSEADLPGRAEIEGAATLASAPTPQVDGLVPVPDKKTTAGIATTLQSSLGEIDAPAPAAQPQPGWAGRRCRPWRSEGGRGQGHQASGTL